MIKYLCALLSMTVISFFSYSQEATPAFKKYNHYAGIQANELLRQLFNLSNTNTAINNPYTVVYSIINAQTNYGLHAGFGYNYIWTDDNTEAANKVTKVNDVFYRVGVEKK